MRLLICICFLFFIASALQAEVPVLQAGEELRYVIKWTGMPAGEIIMSVETAPDDSGGDLELSLKTRTNKLLAALYKIEDEVSSVIQGDKLRSTFFSKNIKQGKRRLLERANIDYSAQQINYLQQNIGKSQKPNQIQLPIESQIIYDPLSIFYAIRLMKFKVGESSESIDVFDRGKLYALSFKAVESSIIHSKTFGERKVFQVEPAAGFEGVLISSGKMTLWVDQETGIALRIKVEIPVGWAVAELTNSNHPNLESTQYRSRRSK